MFIYLSVWCGVVGVEVHLCGGQRTARALGVKLRLLELVAGTFIC